MRREALQRSQLPQNAQKVVIYNVNKEGKHESHSSMVVGSAHCGDYYNEDARAYLDTPPRILRYVELFLGAA